MGGVRENKQLMMFSVAIAVLRCVETTTNHANYFFASDDKNLVTLFLFSSVHAETTDTRILTCCIGTCYHPHASSRWSHL